MAEDPWSVKAGPGEMNACINHDLAVAVVEAACVERPHGTSVYEKCNRTRSAWRFGAAAMADPFQDLLVPVGGWRW